MISHLNKGKNFSILPFKLDITQTLVEEKKFHRSVIWTEYWFGNENQEFSEPIFKTEKTNMPKNYSSPEGLKIFLSSIKSEILDPRNRNNIKRNITQEELLALKELQQLQQDKKIVIRACDKGAGLIILNFDDYIKSCYEHLTSYQSIDKPYYSQVNDIELEQAKKNIRNILLEALENEIISKSEFNAMIADDKNTGRFYCNFKVHKEHEHIPPPRPITSGSGSLTEGIGRFVDHHIKHVATKHKSYLKDTPDFLRCIEKINSGERLHPKAMAATWDVSGLFTNILHHEGLDAMHEALENRETKKVPTDFIVKLMELILTNNIFEFHSTYWKQEVGAAMGSRPVPHYADTFMAKIDKEIKSLSEKYNIGNIEAIQLFKRFLDDFFFIFVGSTKSLHLLLNEANKINPTIQFTMSHTSVENETKEDQCDCEIK